MKNKNSFCIAFLIVAMQAMAQTPEGKLKAVAVSSQIKALYFGELIDGLGKKITNAVVIVKDDRIVEVGKEKEVTVPANAEIIDMSGYTAIPGLIDAHTHMTYYWDKTRPGDPWTQGRTVQPAVKVFLAQENAKKTLETGVTTVRDLGASDNMSFAMRDLIDRGAMKGPRMFVAGQGLGISRTKGITDVQQFAEKQIALGADWVKMFGSTGSAKDVTGFQTYSYEEMKAAAEVAHKAGKRLAVHSYGPDGAKAAVKAGANTIEHATDVDDSTFADMARLGTFYVPTVDHNRYYAAHKDEYGYDSTVVLGLNLFVKRNFESLKKAVKANVKIAMGSDAVFTGFGENTRELEWFVKAGMTPEQALQTATTTGAKMLGREKELGAIAPGYYADIVGVQGNPLKDIQVVIQQVKWVMKGGKVEIDKTTPSVGKNVSKKAIQKNPIALSELTITQIHAAYKKGKFTSQQLVAAYTDRINQFDNQINAITTLNPQAMAIAKALDEEYKRTKILRPLHGIPLIVKDNINTKGLATTAGALALKDFVPDADAFVIDKLIKAGAIIIAKSNMAEWAFTPWHSFSSTNGATLNPYNLEHVPAGSSGGTGASVAANFGTIGLGTDTGNSIRGPSSHNSLVGFRTTLGLISRADIVPLNLKNDVVGPMCRTVEDATRVLEIMVGNDPNDPITQYSEGKIPQNYTQFLQKNGLKGARIGVLREICENMPVASGLASGTGMADPEVKALFEKSILDMKSMGAIIIDTLIIPDFSNLRKNLWCSDFRGDLEAYLSKYVKNDTIKTLEDIVRIGSKSKSAEARVKANVTATTANCQDAYTSPQRMAFRKAIEDKMDELKLDAIIYPTWNNKPAKTNTYNEELKRVEYYGDNSQIIAPHTGQPAFTVPMGFTKGNLPAGLQFLGRMYAEPTLIKLVYAYEQGTNHRVPPTIKK